MNDLDSTTAGYEELANPTANEGKGWHPIVGDRRYFTGTFNGQGYEIRDLYINLLGIGFVGLFSIVDEGGRVENIGIVNANVTSTAYIGGLVGFNEEGTVSNSYSTGGVSGNSSVGGLMGHSEGTVSNSFWDRETSGQTTSTGGMGKTTVEMQDIATSSAVGWNIFAVASGSTNPTYIWNIVDDETYPFLIWQS